MSFGCVNEIVMLVLVTVIIVYVRLWCSVQFFTEEHHFSLVTVCECDRVIVTSIIFC